MSDIQAVKDSIKSTKLSDENAKKLAVIIDGLPDILGQLDNPEYDEIFGYRINVADKEYVDVLIRNEILLKFLAADGYDLDLAKERLINTFNWRNKFQPLSAAFDENFHVELVELGVITHFNKDVKLPNLDIATWNLYGNLKNPKKIFEKFGGKLHKDLPGSEFLRWRIGLMERALQLLDFTNPDLNRIAQVHDYKNVSILRIDPGMRAATKEIIKIFGDNYPELLSTKFFVNVPLLAGWVFTFLKALGIITEETLRKFQVLNHGDLLKSFGADNLPIEYGGKLKKDLFALEVSNVKLSEYGQVILKRIGDEEIKHVNDDVE